MTAQDETLEERKRQFGANLTDMIRLRGINAAEMSRRLGIQRSTMYSYTSGVAIPNIVVLSMIADELDVSIDSLLGRKKQKRSDRGEALKPSLDKSILERLVINLSLLSTEGQMDVLEYSNVLVKAKKYERKNMPDSAVQAEVRSSVA